MKTIQFNYHRGEGFISKAIMIIGEGQCVTVPNAEDATFSHASINFGGDRFEAVMFGGYIKNGEQTVNTSKVIESYEIKVTNKVYAYLYDWCERKVGLKYDYTGVFSNVLPILMKPKKGKLYCSEANNIIYELAIGNKPNYSMSQKISPTGSRNKMRSEKDVIQIT